MKVKISLPVLPYLFPLSSLPLLSLPYLILVPSLSPSFPFSPHLKNDVLRKDNRSEELKLLQAGEDLLHGLRAGFLLHGADPNHHLLERRCHCYLVLLLQAPLAVGWLLRGGWCVPCRCCIVLQGERSRGVIG